MFLYTRVPNAQIPTAQLVGDFGGYFHAAKALHDAEKTQAPPPQLKQLAEIFNSHRDACANNLSEISGAMPWLEIKTLLKEICDPNSVLYSILNTSEALDTKNPLSPAAVAGLDSYFVEVLANSIDALLHQFLKNASDNTQLTMRISLQIKEERVEIQITDNAGGFPLEFLKQHENPQTRRKQNPGISAKQSEDYHYYLGGESKGIEILQEAILTSDPTATINFENTCSPAEPGAKITIDSSIKPPARLFNIEPPALAKTSSVLSPPPLRHVKKSDQKEKASPNSTRKLLSNSPPIALHGYFHPHISTKKPPQVDEEPKFDATCSTHTIA